MLSIHTTGNWSRGQVRASLVASTRRIDSEVEKLIEHSWNEGRARLGVKLFDGSMCRMESWDASPDVFDLELSLTSYRIFLGTNLSNHDVADRFGRDVMANPVGISTVLLTCDGWLLYGRRNASVAYYPNRVHPFAGALEEKDLSDVFGAIEREMHEELMLAPADIESIRCIGIAEDQAIKHPELIFHTRSRLAWEQIESQVHGDEHGGSVAVQSSRDAIEAALADLKEFTPIAAATLLLFGNDAFGGEWFHTAATRLGCVGNWIQPAP